MLHHVLNISDFKKEDLDYILSVAGSIAGKPSLYREVAKGKILATLFFEPSTRTRLSFESAMLRLGGSVIGFSDMSASSTSKGETIEDTARTVCCYCDIMCVRHFKELAPHAMAKVSTVPLMNAGDGANEHPTQTLTDLVTISEKFHRLDNLTIGLCGDLKYGRTVHSLIKMLSRYHSNKFVLISPPELAMPAEIIEMLDKEEVEYEIISDLKEAMPKLDILYMTRIQRERFPNIEDYNKLKGVYVLDREKMGCAKKDMIVMHPLPRVDEIDIEVDRDSRAWYFKQAQYGVYARMALIIAILGLHDLRGEEELYVSSNKGRNTIRLPYGA